MPPQYFAPGTPGGKLLYIYVFTLVTKEFDRREGSKVFEEIVRQTVRECQLKTRRQSNRAVLLVKMRKREEQHQTKRRSKMNECRTVFKERDK